MPSRIELSKAFTSGSNGSLTNRITTQGWNNENAFFAHSHYGIFGGSYNNNYGYNTSINALNGDYSSGNALTIMKGTIPSSIAQIAPNMTVPEMNSRSTDVCLAFETRYSHFSPSQFQVNPVIVSTIFVPAISTGTAAWFWLRGWASIYNNGQITQSVIGTVGLLGSGADLEMADVNILSGDNYRISALKLEFPTSWEF